MNCVFCKGSLVKRQVAEEVKVGTDHILVQIEAEVCENCHEKYYAEGTVDYLQKLRKELKTNKSRFRAIGQVYETAAG